MTDFITDLVNEQKELEKDGIKDQEKQKIEELKKQIANLSTHTIT